MKPSPSSLGFLALLASSSWAEELCSSSDGAGTLGPGQMVLSFADKLQYNWNDEHVEQEYLDSGAFVPAVNVVTGIDIGSGVQANPEGEQQFDSCLFNSLLFACTKIPFRIPPMQKPMSFSLYLDGLGAYLLP